MPADALRVVVARLGVSEAFAATLVRGSVRGSQARKSRARGGDEPGAKRDRGDRGDRGEPTSGGARSWETELSERRELWELDLCRGETPSGGELCSAPVPENEWPTAFSAEAAASAAAGP